MLIDVELSYPENEISDLTKNSFKHFYDGSEIVVAGRFIDNNQNSLTVDVRGEGVSMDFFDLSKISKCLSVQSWQYLKYVLVLLYLSDREHCCIYENINAPKPLLLKLQVTCLTQVS